MNKYIVLAALMAAFSSSAVFAGYGMAGCGLGSMLIPNENGKEQIFVATTNDYSSQTSAITTGSSNCSEDPAAVAALFISINHEALKRDIARGNGETIQGIAQIFKCENTAMIGKDLQKNYSTIFATEADSSVKIASRIQNSVKADNCSAI